MLYKSTGRIQYSTDPYRVVLNIDQGIADFYRWLVPKAVGLQRQMHSAHISIVRKQSPSDLSKWGLHDGEATEFYYENIVEHCETYYWIHAFTLLGEQIREELGLPVYDSLKAPFGYRQRFHCTIGNLKRDKI